MIDYSFVNWEFLNNIGITIIISYIVGIILAVGLISLIEYLRK